MNSATAWLNVYNKKLIIIAQNTAQLFDIDHNKYVNEIKTCDKIVASCVSTCGTYLALCTQNKRLILYNNNDCGILKEWEVNRSVSQIRFTPTGDLLVADKTGDLYLYTVKNAECIQILGHLSMLLDCLVSVCGQYVITSDRDEKIRVSHFPDAYSIQSYCLGHTEYVSQLEFHRNNGTGMDTLVSASGDGTIRFWDYLTGTQLHVLNTNEHLNAELIETFRKRIETDTNALPISKFQIFRYNVTVMLVSFCFCNQLHVYEIEDSLSTKLLHIIDLVDCKLLSFDLNSNCYVLTDSSINVYKFHNGDKEFKLLENTSELNQFYNEFKNNYISNQLDLIPEMISVLYKRKFDNVLEYQEKKKLRLNKQKL